MFTSDFFTTYPFTEVRSLLVLGDALVISCHSQEQADRILDFADDIARACREVTELDRVRRVRIYVCARHAYGFPTRLFPRNQSTKSRPTATN